MGAVDEVKSRLDIVDVVSSHVPLQRAGRSFKAPCPFHEERTPSFVVSPERQSWHCFGACSTGGDVISFVMRREGVEFGEALRSLAARAGVSLAPASPVQTRSATIHQVSEAAAAFYQGLLYSEAGGPARAYLKSRGLDRDTAVRFRLGLSPADGAGAGSLGARLMAEGYTTEQMVEAGLARRSEGGPARDFFRGRLMFPIADRRGRVCGFGARALDESGPKYINTSASEAFDKGRILYGLDLASETIRARGQAVVVEGYMDVIAAHQHGHGNVVASMGTALTDPQMLQLRSLAPSVVLALDADAAGREATLRRLEEALVAAADRSSAAFSRRVGPIMHRDHIELRIALLPEGSDPDELMRTSPEAWNEVVDGAVPGAEFLIGSLPARFDLSTGAGKTEAARWAAGLIYAANPFDQERYHGLLAKALGVSQAALKPILRDIGKRSVAARRRADRQGAEAARSGDDPAQVPADPARELASRTLAMLIGRPELRTLASGLNPECFERSEDREIFTRCTGDATIEDLRSALDPAVHGRLGDLDRLALEPALPGQAEAAMAQMISRLEERRLRLLQDDLLAGRDPLESGDGVEREIVDVNSRLREIHARRG